MPLYVCQLEATWFLEKEMRAPLFSYSAGLSAFESIFFYKVQE
jgi:hypothetical protein